MLDLQMKLFHLNINANVPRYCVMIVLSKVLPSFISFSIDVENVMDIIHPCYLISILLKDKMIVLEKCLNLVTRKKDLHVQTREKAAVVNLRANESV